MNTWKTKHMSAVASQSPKSLLWIHRKFISRKW